MLLELHTFTKFDQSMATGDLNDPKATGDVSGFQASGDHGHSAEGSDTLEQKEPPTWVRVKAS